MTLTIDLTPEEVNLLEKQAQIQGVDVATVLRGLLVYLPASTEEEAGDGRPSLEDLEVLFAELAEGYENRPVLAPEATTRAGIYTDMTVENRL